MSNQWGNATFNTAFQLPITLANCFSMFVDPINQSISFGVTFATEGYKPLSNAAGNCFWFAIGI